MDIIKAYLITFGWAIIGSVSMALGLIIGMKVFEKATPGIDLWALVKGGSMPVAVILAAVILALAIVIAAAILPS